MNFSFIGIDTKA